MNFIPTPRHTVEAFQLACEQLEDDTNATLFEVLANPENFEESQVDLAEYLDNWDCWLFTEESQAVLG